MKKQFSVVGEEKASAALLSFNSDNVTYLEEMNKMGPDILKTWDEIDLTTEEEWDIPVLSQLTGPPPEKNEKDIMPSTTESMATTEKKNLMTNAFDNTAMTMQKNMTRMLGEGKNVFTNCTFNFHKW